MLVLLLLQCTLLLLLLLLLLCLQLDLPLCGREAGAAANVAGWCQQPLVLTKP
jgi:hypothetical protein